MSRAEYERCKRLARMLSFPPSFLAFIFKPVSIRDFTRAYVNFGFGIDDLRRASKY